MFIGHFAVADLILAINPKIPSLPILLGVSYPDLLWPVLVLTGKEKVVINPNSPLQKNVNFLFYPYSHSVVLSSAFTIIPALIIALIYHSFFIGFLFWIAALSHWLLDWVVHVPDMPIFGFGKDKKVGLGLWRNGPFAFTIELLLYVAIILLLVPQQIRAPLLDFGVIASFINVNTFFGFSKKNLIKSGNQYVLLTLVGFGIMIIFTALAWNR